MLIYNDNVLLGFYLRILSREDIFLIRDIDFNISSDKIETVVFLILFIEMDQSSQIDILKIRADFPILDQEVYGRPLIYFDNAATTQKPKQVMELIDALYRQCNSNVHRGVHCLSGRMTEAYEAARLKIKNYLNACSEREIVFTSGATAAINLAAFCFGEAYVRPGDEIIVSTMEHHSNLVPWQIMCRRRGAVLKAVPFDERGELMMDKYQEMIGSRTKLAAVVHVSNSLGTVNPIREIISMAHDRDVPVLVDGAQAVAHLPVDVQDLGCDFYAFSGHKMYGPTGTGVLYAREKWLKEMPPYQSGGDMIEKVTLQETTYSEPPFKFEAGTPNYIGFVGLGAAVDYLVSLGLDRIREREKDLLEYGSKKLSQVEGLKIYGSAKEKVPNFSFTYKDISPYDLGMLLDRAGIAVRTGHHCTQPIWDYYGVAGSVRASLAVYNTYEEIDKLVETLQRIGDMFR